MIDNLPHTEVMPVGSSTSPMWKSLLRNLVWALRTASGSNCSTSASIAASSRCSDSGPKRDARHARAASISANASGSSTNIVRQVIAETIRAPIPPRSNNAAT